MCKLKGSSAWERWGKREYAISNPGDRQKCPAIWARSASARKHGQGLLPSRKKEAGTKIKGTKVWSVLSNV